MVGLPLQDARLALRLAWQVKVRRQFDHVIAIRHVCPGSLLCGSAELSIFKDLLPGLDVGAVGSEGKRGCT